MFAVEYGSGKRQEGFETKTDALMWAGQQHLNNFEIFDGNGNMVYQEFPHGQRFV